MKTFVFLLQYGKSIVQLETKVHMDTLGTNGGPHGVPQNSPKNGT